MENSHRNTISWKIESNAVTVPYSVAEAAGTIARWERDSGRHSIPPGSYATDATLGLLRWWTDDYEAFAFESPFAGPALAGICDVKSSTP
ncbi:hypothetical protein CSOJ01_02944 [Colletotrichum sojae]|uniref:Uncharacterized protein n=1 Tax=Colletotrichum sojae TaxID=2175907 RepID=A0A8H6JPB7_9PEZI|nr:hypothetical protein CSOJ01_02944 [Colletotrichum sojae]